MLMAVVMGLLAQSEGPVKLAVPGLTLSGVETALGEAWVERFATILSRSPDLKVTTRRDIEQLLGFERQKQLLGCSDQSSSCLAELAGGLGVDAVLSGSLAKTGSSYIVTMRVIRATDGSELASTSERLNNEDAVSEWLEAEAPRLAERITVAMGRSPKARAAAPPKAVGGHLERWIPGMVGAALLIGGGAMEISSRVDAEKLTAGTVPIAQVSSVVDRGRTLETGGWILIGVGAAGVAASVVWALAGPRAPKVAVLPVNGGAMVGLSGALP